MKNVILGHSNTSFYSRKLWFAIINHSLIHIPISHCYKRLRLNYGGSCLWLLLDLNILTWIQIFLFVSYM